MPRPFAVDALDARILSALNDDPRATVIALADKTGLSRNTVQARLGMNSKSKVCCRHSNAASTRLPSDIR